MASHWGPGSVAQAGKPRDANAVHIRCAERAGGVEMPGTDLCRADDRVVVVIGRQRQQRMDKIELLPQ